MRDTTAEVLERMCAMIRAKSPIERLKMGSSMFDTSKHLVIRAILADKPDISQMHLRKELFLKFYGDDIDSITKGKIIEHLERCTKEA